MNDDKFKEWYKPKEVKDTLPKNISWELFKFVYQFVTCHRLTGRKYCT